MEEPMNTLISFENFQLDDVPWLTICQTPAFSFSRMENVVTNVTGSSRASFGLNEGLNTHQWSNYPPRLNMSTNEFLAYVGVPLWSVISSCSVQDTGRGFTSTLGSCDWPASSEHRILVYLHVEEQTE
jgi:hypothetical protein